IRVLSPDAGSSNLVGQNRGFVFVPEINDQVMVDFENGNPDRPFVTGSAFHGKIAAGGGKHNNIKNIATKSGHSIRLNDGGGITIKDKKGNIVRLHGNGEISIKSASKINVVSKDIDLEASNNISINAGNNIELNACNINLNTSTNKEGGGGMIVVKAQKNTVLQSLEDSVNITANAKDVVLHGAGNINADAGTQILITSKDTQIF
ncbi:phage baseplate assembly protein V, partial [Pedobacter nototheniae]|uniref:phage baseplate assembly protein V n=1 Tax=Pedobacter nototheniae TaxID=2488994 RepID=UPI001FECC258